MPQVVGSRAALARAPRAMWPGLRRALGAAVRDSGQRSQPQHARRGAPAPVKRPPRRGALAVESQALLDEVIWELNARAPEAERPLKI